MKKCVVVIFLAIVLTVSIIFTAASIEKRRACDKAKAKILDIPAESYILKAERDGKQGEVIVAENSFNVYYFTKDNEKFELHTGDLIGKFFYLEEEEFDYDRNVWCIRYTPNDSQIVIDEKVIEENVSLDYDGFKAYCLNYFGDTEDKNFAQSVYAVVQECLASSRIKEISKHIDSSISISVQIKSTIILNKDSAYYKMVCCRLNDEQKQIFEKNLLAVPSGPHGKSVQLTLYTDVEMTTVYPHIFFWHMGMDYLDIRLF